MLLDAIFSPRILFFFFLLQGAWLRGKQKTYFFFLVLTITPVIYALIFWILEKVTQTFRVLIIWWW